MRELVLTQYFSRRFAKFQKKHPELLEKIEQVLEMLQINPYTPVLETHKLKGKLEKRYACTVAYDLRIIFSFDPRDPPELAAVVLLNIGTHDEVY